MEPNFECAAQNGAEPLCRETAAVLCIMAKSDTAMTALGQSRRFDRCPATSGLPPETDIVRGYRHVSNVPCVDGSELARAFFTFCSICRHSHVFCLQIPLTSPLPLMPSPHPVPCHPP